MAKYLSLSLKMSPQKKDFCGLIFIMQETNLIIAEADNMQSS